MGHKNMSNAIEQQQQDVSGFVILCEGCKEPLIQRLSNGLWKFKWGRQQKFNEDNELIYEWTPIELYVHGTIRIKCFRKDCAHWNDLTFLPNVNEIETIEQITERFQEIKELLDRFPKARQRA